ncbi:FMN-binding negative transcriptional regulator [Pseudoalteromonas sp. McH1-7]|uniref:Transcriptional regulator n=1 Tax=Pseudoalteromonas peptidolytica F12-50-A1 TaxID=1315280 RepID=A0A8I0T6K3_9GAMM|nr:MULTISPECIES: FMN-binding negative transcriptional regulator [Pseudoalteromonas]MBE0349230.1 transcriptional regulator [Pseudoalteromonas peptidolytica F12-50-A1]MDW7549037.1 FMN-binding negative transcriptional regulator [Pseudoalteromonas peptidolytica]NLR16450.1 transcriptional regulator [Pseudoalteromonas peptidolytica]NUZ12613.1 FMN-binding negative transcriptional regulator [Pseudoalteromonas sp. McH1-7]RXF01196.1 transcriptional regulator [Pseudoalteromonas sp. PS5]
MSYPRKYYTENNQETLYALIAMNPLATINVIQANKVRSVFIPLTLSDDKTYLLGHATKDNPLFSEDDDSFQAIFHCQNHYLSPALLPDIKLPTWLYANVIVEGELTLVSQDNEKYALMQNQLQHFEQFSRSNWQLDSVPQPQQRSLFNAINFFQIRITQLHGAFKLSQNKSPHTRMQIKAHLEQYKPTLSQRII